MVYTLRRVVIWENVVFKPLPAFIFIPTFFRLKHGNHCLNVVNRPWICAYRMTCKGILEIRQKHSLCFIQQIQKQFLTPSHLSRLLLSWRSIPSFSHQKRGRCCRTCRDKKRQNQWSSCTLQSSTLFYPCVGLH